MKKTDFAKYKIEDLQKEIAEKREALRGFRFGSAGSRSRNTREGRNLRKEIARLLTELNSRTLASRKKSA
ncbi:MAG TPA: 50S ribosomal protein L29 [Candidatus Paceibacterota bacterium]|nr:50S ribosomal protein L29 [Candidatus Paceibacterota bacterium]